MANNDDWRPNVKSSDYGYDAQDDGLKTTEINPPGMQQTSSERPGLPGIPIRNPFGNGMPSVPKLDKDLLDRMFSYRTYPLLVAKGFYFFFFAAFGSLFPLLGVYFKQLGMNPAQCGMLIGVRPFIELCSAPMWGGVADRFKKGKTLLLLSMVCWIAFTIGLAYIQPPANSCVMLNGTELLLVDPWAVNNPELVELKDAPPKYLDLGRSPIPIDAKDFANIPNEEAAAGLVSPTLTNIVYRTKDIHGVFLVLLILMIIAEFFSAPALTLADSATLGSLDNSAAENYGKQRMFGSIGWAVSMFIVGIALDTSNTFHDHPCGHSQVGEKNYTVCFIVFSILMVCAFAAATQFRFSYDGKEATELSDIKNKVMFTAKNLMAGKISMQGPDGDMGNMEQTAPPCGRVDGGDTGGNQDPWGTGPGQQQQQHQQSGPTGGGGQWDTSFGAENGQGAPNPQGQNGVYRKTSLEQQLNINLQPSGNAQTQNLDDIINTHSPFIPRGKPGQSGTVPNMKAVFKLFLNIHYAAILFVTWFMGFGIGLVFTFLFWHLQDLNGAPTLFGFASVINHISELIAYFYSAKLIMTIGHLRVIYIGLFGNIARFLYISWIRNPWAVLPFEFIQGLTHAAVWAACCSYITQSMPPHLRSSAQTIVQSIHHGLGRGCGAVLGGFIVYGSGSEWAFRGYGIACIFVSILYKLLNMVLARRGDLGPMAEAGMPGDPTEDLHLAPHGVPSGLGQKMNNDQYGNDGGATGQYSAGYDAQYGSTAGQGQGQQQDGGYNPQGGGSYASGQQDSYNNYPSQEQTPQQMGGYGYQMKKTNPFYNDAPKLTSPELQKETIRAFREGSSLLDDCTKSRTRALIITNPVPPPTQMFLQQDQNMFNLETTDDLY